MAKISKLYNRYRIPFLVSVIVISVSGSLILLAYQGASIKQQSMATVEQVKEVKSINEELVRQSKNSEKQIERVIQENQKQTSYIECLLNIQGYFTDELKNECEQQAETKQQSQSPSTNSSPTPTNRPLSNPESQEPTPQKQEEPTPEASVRDIDNPSKPEQPERSFMDRILEPLREVL